MKTKLISIVLLLIVLNVTHANIIGRVIKVKGKASLLAPHEKAATMIKVGQSIVQDSSILTQNKSIVIIKFKDKTRMVVGPKSKVIVKKFTKQNQGVISLLKGRLRTKVQKNSKNDLKFFIKSRTASLGVRGTSFQTSYNPENNLTSLLTFSGEVAMVNTKKINKMNKGKKEISITQLSKAFKSKSAVSVKAGTYSGVSDNLKIATKPVKIAPKQFAHIKLNDSFGIDQKKITKKEIELEVKKIEKTFAKDKTNKESQDLHINPDTGQYHPRSGGFVDIETGIYIPPTKDSVYDKKLKIFTHSKKIGSISNTGKYIAPKGVTLSATKGFVAKNDSSASKSLLKELNHQIKGQVKKAKPIKYSLDNLNNEDVYERYFEN